MDNQIDLLSIFLMGKKMILKETKETYVFAPANGNNLPLSAYIEVNGIFTKTNCEVLKNKEGYILALGDNNFKVDTYHWVNPKPFNYVSTVTLEENGSSFHLEEQK